MLGGSAICHPFAVPQWHLHFCPTIYDILDQMELVFNRLKQFNLKIKPKKCQFFNTSVLFLGNVWSAKGISANPEKLEKVKYWPVPQKIREVQSFLGLASYYRKFINQFAKKAWCLHKLMGPTSNKHKKKNRIKKNTTTVTEPGPRIFKWMTEHQDVFDALKEALSLLQYWDIPASPGSLFWTQMLFQRV